MTNGCRATVASGIGFGLLLLPSVIVGVPGGVAAAASTDLPGGASLTIALASPLANTVVETGVPITVAGSASIGEAPAVKNTDLVFVIDTSGSTGDPSGIGCGTVLECEKQAVTDLVVQASAVRSPIKQVGLTAFPDADVVNLVAPNSSQISDYLDSLSPGGFTDFSAGLDRAATVLQASTAEHRLIVMLTDGEGTVDPDQPAISAVVMAFTIGGQQCTPPLLEVVDLGDDGSACSVVTDLSNLSGVIGETIGATLEEIAVTVDGAAAYVSDDSIPGPGTTTFSTVVTGLTIGTHSLCAVATGVDALGSAQAQECVNVRVVAPGTVIVDCGAVSGDCVANATDPGRSTLTFRAPPVFDESVTLVPNVGASTTCGGTPCRTGYDVLFPTTSGTGPVVSLTVLTAQPVSLRDRLQAAVFIDNVRITAQCDNRTLAKLVRDLLGKPEPIPCITIQYQSDGRVEYFVKFKSDPGVRFR